MNPQPPLHPRRRQINVWLHRWHKRIGVAACTFVVWMVVSGWLLNHSPALGLAEHQLQLPWLARWYGLHSELPRNAWNTQQHWLVSSNDQLLLDGHRLPQTLEQPLGLVQAGRWLFIANGQHLLMYTADGQPVDNIALPIADNHRLLRIGSNGQQLIIVGDGHAQTSTDGTSWTPYSGTALWSQPQPLTAAQTDQIQPLLVPTISWERLLLDLHSGRALGHYGPYFIDSVGLALLLLACSGLWMTLRRPKHRSSKGHPHAKP